MNTTPADAAELARTIASRTREAGVTRVIRPPYVSLAAVRDALAGEDVGIGAQNVHHELAGGLHRRDLRADAGRPGLLGDPRRLRAPRLFGETDELIGKKLDRAVAGGLRPILCVGEVLADREAGREAEVVGGQLRGALEGRDPATLVVPRGSSSRTSRVGHRNRQERVRRRRGRHGRRDPASLRSLGWGDGATATPVLYGGSVTSANIGEFLAEPGVDGALIGGASLKPDEMAGIAARAGITAQARGLASRRGRPGPRPIVLVVLDGFGIGSEPAKDAIAAAAMPALARRRCQVAAFGAARIGRRRRVARRPDGQLRGRSLNLGVGRPVLQDLPRIDAAIEDGSFYGRPALIAACERAKETGRLDAVGLIGPAASTPTTATSSRSWSWPLAWACRP